MCRFAQDAVGRAPERELPCGSELEDGLSCVGRRRTWRNELAVGDPASPHDEHCGGAFGATDSSAKRTRTRRYARHNDHGATTFGSDVRYSRRSATGAHTADPGLTRIRVSSIEPAPRPMSG
jgi:hypothetical protein